jgi:hypothetical protein
MDQDKFPSFTDDCIKHLRPRTLEVNAESIKLMRDHIEALARGEKASTDEWLAPNAAPAK